MTRGPSSLRRESRRAARTAACCRTDTACSAVAWYSSLAWSRAAAREHGLWGCCLQQPRLPPHLAAPSHLWQLQPGALPAPQSPAPRPLIKGGRLAAQVRMLFPRSQSDSPPAPPKNLSQTPASSHDASVRTSQRGCNQNTSRTRTKPLLQPAPHAHSLCCWPPCLSSCSGPALLAPAAPLFLSCATHNLSSSAIGSLWGTSATGHFSPPLLPCCLSQQPLTWPPTPALCAGLSTVSE